MNNQGGYNSIESISGVQPPTASAVERITLQNYDSNPALVNKTQNQTHFLGLTAQYLTSPFKAINLDYAFNDKNQVGTNSFSNEELVRQRYNEKGAGFRMFELA